MAERTFTSKDIIDAMERNGYRRANGAFVQFKGGKFEGGIEDVYAACAVGQALLNLGVLPNRVPEAADYLPAQFHHVYTLNDDEKWALRRIVKEAKTWDIYTDPLTVRMPDDLFTVE